MYTLDYNIAQLNRMQDWITAGQPLRIIHILVDYSDGFSSYWEDRYIVLVDCDPKMYTLLCLI
jgi:hypothetical protein